MPDVVLRPLEMIGAQPDDETQGIARTASHFRRSVSSARPRYFPRISQPRSFGLAVRLFPPLPRDS